MNPNGSLQHIKMPASLNPVVVLHDYFLIGNASFLPNASKPLTHPIAVRKTYSEDPNGKSFSSFNGGTFHRKTSEATSDLVFDFVQNQYIKKENLQSEDDSEKIRGNIAESKAIHKSVELGASITENSLKVNPSKSASGHACDICKRVFAGKLRLKTHRLLHTGEKPHQCTECGKKFTRSDTLKNHRVVHSNKWLTGRQSGRQQSGQTLTDTSSRRTSQPNGINTSISPGCSLLKINNRNPQEDDSDKQAVFGGTSAEMTEDGTESINNSERSVNSINNGSASVEIIIESDAEEPASLEIPPGSTASSHVCDICNEGFTHSEHLKTHRLIHTGEMPYGCTKCEKRFTHSNYLKWHIRIHHSNNSAFLKDKELREENVLCDDQSGSKAATVDGDGECPIVPGRARSDSAASCYVCDVCNESFTRLTRLKTHSVIHMAEKTFCSECNKKFTDSADLKRHIEVYHSVNSKSLSPSLEDSELSEEDSHREDETDSHGSAEGDGSDSEWSVGSEKNLLGSTPKSYVCDICDKVFSRNDSLKNHRLVHTGEKPYKCAKCEAKFTRLSNLNRHMRVNCGKDKNKISFPVADLNDGPVSAVEDCSDVKESITSGENTPKSTPSCFECDVCHKAFIRSKDLVAHCLVHTGENPYECTECESKFTRMSNLNRHIRAHRCKNEAKISGPATDSENIKEINVDCEDRTNSSASVVEDGSVMEGSTASGENASASLCFACDVCNKTFTQINDLKSHCMVHTDEKPYECTECEMKFTRFSSLRRHIKTHRFKNSANLSGLAMNNLTGLEERGMECEDEAISNAVVKDVSNMEGSVTSEKNASKSTQRFVCDVCDRRFTHFNHLKTHSMIHTVERTYECTECEKKFPRSDSLRRHMERHRSESSTGASCSVTDKEPCNTDTNLQLEGPDTSIGKDDSNSEGLVVFEKNPSASSHFVCDVCNRGFITESHLKTHSLIHVGETSNVCSECGKTFATSDYLKNHKEHWHKEVTDPAMTHKCSQCEEKFTTLHSLAIHCRIHGTEKRHVCTVCSKSFEYKTRLNAHFEIHVNARPFVCSICGKGFNKNTTLKTHLRTHTSDKPYQCVLCDARFTAKNALTRHVHLHTGEKPHECDVCHKKFACSSYLKNHLLIHTGEKPYVCDICQKKFSRKNLLDEHKSIHSGDRPYQCDVCERSFSYQYKLKMHYRTHTNDKQFFCDICNKGFLTKHNLSEHRRLHTGEKPYVCGYCKKAFAYLNSYERHLLIHTGAKPFACKVCDMSFNQKGSLLRHQVVHTGEKPYPCDICHQSFTQKSYLSIHRLIHSGERPYVCEICQESFTRRSELKKHTCKEANERAAHSGERSFICEFCKESFTRRTDLKKHTCTHATRDLTDSGEQALVCEYCEESFTRRSDLGKHKCTEATPNPADSAKRTFACEFCEESFTSRSDLKKHTCKEVEFKIEWVPDDQVYNFSTLF